jgi:zinc protease
VAERSRTAEPPPNAERRVTMRDARASTPSWQRQYLTSAARHLPQREELAMSLLADILGGGNQSRLYQKLTVEKKIAAYAGAWFSADMLDYGTFGLYAAPNAGVVIEEVEKGVDEVLADLIAKGITQEELDRSRSSLIAGATYLLDSQESLARVFGVALTTGQTIEDVMNWETDIAQVTLDDVNKAARTAFDARASVTGVLLPEATIQ